MKGMLLLVLAIGAVASPLLLADLHSGYHQGLQGPSYCLEHPGECGETVGQLLSLATSSYRKIREISCISCTQSFIIGLTNGLRGTNFTESACVADFVQGNYDLAVLYQVIWTAIYNFDLPITFIEVADLTCSISAVLGVSFLSDCHFGVLLNNLENLSLNLLVTEYEANLCTVNQAVSGLMECAYNYQYCGYSVGFLIKTFVNWSI